MKKPILLVAAAVAIAVLALAGAGCTQKSRTAKALAKADQYFTAGEYDNAVIEYKNVLQVDHLNPRAISQLGLIYFDQGRLSQVMGFLQKGRELEPNNFEVRGKLGQIYISIGKHKEARDEANFLLEHDPKNPDAPLLLVASALNPEENEADRVRLQKLPPPTPDTAPVLVALGMIEFRKREFAAAEASFKKALAQDPKSVIAHSALGTLYRVQKDLPKAEQAYKAAADLAPIRSGKVLQYAQFKIQTGELEAGRKLLNGLVEKAPDYLPGMLALAEIMASEKKYAESEAMVAKVLARDPTHPEALLLSSKLKLAGGAAEKAVDELERMVKMYPQSPQAHFNLGRAHFADGEMNKASASLNQAVALAPGYTEAVVALAELNIRRGDYRLAIVALKPLLEQQPQIVQARFLLADAYRGQGDLDDALAVYRQLEAALPNSPQTQMLMGLVYIRQKKVAEARQALTKAVELAPDFLTALEQLINLDLSEKNYQGALQRVDGLIAKHPALPGGQMLLAKIHLAQNDMKKAEAALLSGIKLQPDSPGAYLLLARLYISTNEFDKALANLQEVIAKNPKDIGALMVMGTIYDHQKNHKAARETYEQLLVLNPKFSAALNNLAVLYSEHFNELDKAHDLAQKARDLLPLEPNTADTLGWILYKKRQYPRALSLLQESADKLPDNAVIHYHLGMVQYMMGGEAAARITLRRALELDKAFSGNETASRCLAVLDIDPGTAGASAEPILNQVLEENPDDPVALYRRAAVYERAGAMDKAIGSYQAAVQAGPKNVRAAMKLVRLYVARKDTPKALELAKNARKVAPDDPEVAEVLGRLSYQAREFQRAYSLRQELARGRPDDPEVQFDLAESAYSVGRVAEAEEAMKRTLVATTLFARKDEARQFLELIALPANPAQLGSGAANLGQILKAEPDNVPALMAQAALSEQQAASPAARQAYEKVLARFPDFAPAKKRLAILLGEDPAEAQKAYDFAIKAREAYPDDAELARVLGITLYRQKEYARSAKELQASAAQRPTDAELRYYLGMANLRLNKKPESKQALQQALDLGLKPELAAEAKRNLAELK